MACEKGSMGLLERLLKVAERVFLLLFLLLAAQTRVSSDNHLGREEVLKAESIC